MIMIFNINNEEKIESFYYYNFVHNKNIKQMTMVVRR